MATTAKLTKIMMTLLLALYLPLISTEMILAPLLKIFSWFIRMDASAPPPDCILPLTQTSSLLRVTFASLSSISPGHFSVNTLKARGLISTENALMKRIQKNCTECTRAHCRCVFELVDDVKCTHCNKFCLCCMFRVSGMFTFFYYIVISNHLFTFINKYHLRLFYTSEQVHCNNLNQVWCKRGWVTK